MDIKKGDVIYFADTNWIPVARVGAIKKNSVDAVATIKAGLPFDVYTQRYVLLLESAI